MIIMIIFSPSRLYEDIESPTRVREVNACLLPIFAIGYFQICVPPVNMSLNCHLRCPLKTDKKGNYQSASFHVAMINAETFLKTDRRSTFERPSLPWPVVDAREDI
jgi:hypothetical protein